MPQDVYEEFLQLVKPFMSDSNAANPTFRTYSKRHKLIITLYFLSHSSTMRTLSRIFGAQQNSISTVIIHPTVHALQTVFIDNSETKNIRFASGVQELAEIMAGFQKRYKLPGVIGALDGTLVPQKKPAKEQSGGDTKAWWSYKGCTASLMLAVCDAHHRLLWVSAGAQGMVGDAGLYKRSSLAKKINEGHPRKMVCSLAAAGVERSVHPYLVADSAFPLGPHIMKAYDRPVCHKPPYDISAKQTNITSRVP
jgi:hypothetical protein